MQCKPNLLALLGGLLAFAGAQTTAFAQLGTPEDDGCTDRDIVIVCSDSDGDGIGECDNGGWVTTGTDGKKYLWPGGKELTPTNPPKPNPTPEPEPEPEPKPEPKPAEKDQEPLQESKAVGFETYALRGTNKLGGITYVVILTDNANPNDSPGPYHGGDEIVDKGLADSPLGFNEMEMTYFSLLQIGFTHEEAILLVEDSVLLELGK